MPVLYKIAPVKSHFDPDGKTRYIARPTRRQTIGLKEFSQMMAARSTVSRGDVSLVLNGLTDLMLELLEDNHSVRLDGLGIFSLSFKSEVADSPDQITYTSVKDIRLQFLPDKSIKQELSNFRVLKS